MNSIANNGDFDPRSNDKPRVEPKDEIVPLQVGKCGQDTQINANLKGEDKEKIIDVLADNKHLFA